MKKNIKGYVVLGILFAVFTVIAFAVPFVMRAAFWSGYLFGILAIAFQLYVFKVAFDGEDTAKSRFYGFPIAKIGVLYLVVQLVISLIEMGTAAVLPAWVAVIINIILLAAAAVGCIAADTVREEVVRQDVQVQKDVSAMRMMQTLSASLISVSEDPSVKAELKKLADEFRYSDPVTSDATMESEEKLKENLDELKDLLAEDQKEEAQKLIRKISISLKERNQICAMNKH